MTKEESAAVPWTSETSLAGRRLQAARGVRMATATLATTKTTFFGKRPALAFAKKVNGNPL